MKRPLTGLALALAAVTVSAQDLPPLARFQGGIGSQPLASTTINGVFTIIPNDVNGVAPGGRPWEIAKLQAVVAADGTIKVQGKGLILGGGGNVGRPGLPRSVNATLFCGGNPSNSLPAPLDAQGDFTIDSPLSPAPANPCVNPTLLIRNFAGGAPGPWFAAGIPKD